MRGFACTLGIAMLCSTAIAAVPGLPPEVTQQLENVVAFDEPNDFVGSYRVTISSLIQKPNGKSREEELIEAWKLTVSRRFSSSNVSSTWR